MVSPERLEAAARDVEVSDCATAGLLRAAARRIRELELLGDFKILRLQEGDRIALMCTPELSADQAARMRSQAAVWADIETVNVAVFAAGVELQILRDEARDIGDPTAGSRPWIAARRLLRQQQDERDGVTVGEDA